MKSKKRVITGASGFLGSHLLHACAPEQAIGLYCSTRPEGDGYRYMQLDFSEREACATLLRNTTPDVVIHAAAKSNPDWCERHREQAWRVNAEAPVWLAEACAAIGCRFVFVSSDMVFDGARSWYREDDATNPISWYGKTKLVAEQGVLRANPHAVVARVALIFGRPVAPGRGSSFLLWILEKLESGEPVPLFYDQYRTPVEVGELAQTLLALAESPVAGVIHVGGSERVDRYTFGRYVCECIGADTGLLRRTSLKQAENLAPRPQDLSLDTTRLHQILGYRLSDCRSALRRLFR